MGVSFPGWSMEPEKAKQKQIKDLNHGRLCSPKQCLLLEYADEGGYFYKFSMNPKAYQKCSKASCGKLGIFEPVYCVCKDEKAKYCSQRCLKSDRDH